MKKRILTIALVLALCLGLAIPAMATEPREVEGRYLRVTNVVDLKRLDYETEAYTCVASARVSPGTGDDGADAFEVRSVKVIKLREDLAPTMNVYTYWNEENLEGGTEVTTRDGDGVVLNDPGCYIAVVDTGYPTPEMFLLTVQAPADQAPAAPKFTDVKDTDWFAKPVAWAVEKNITTGTTATTFSPTQDCSVAQILTFLWRAAGSPEAKGIDGMDANLYYAGAVAWAVEKGMISAEDFTATAPCTRSMAVQFIWQAADSPKADAASFEDVPADAEYADAVAWAVKEGVTTGTSETTFAPDTVCNRGHIVTFLYRAFAE